MALCCLSKHGSLHSTYYFLLSHCSTWMWD
jgi:hypothetical protein